MYEVTFIRIGMHSGNIAKRCDKAVEAVNLAKTLAADETIDCSKVFEIDGRWDEEITPSARANAILVFEARRHVHEDCECFWTKKDGLFIRRGVK